MEVQLTSDQEAFIRQGIKTGRYAREEEALKEAMLLWEERERSRAGLMAALEVGELSLANGGGRIITEVSMRELATEVKERGRSRLAAERSTK
jgi:putative addiction module CopG family antidote